MLENFRANVLKENENWFEKLRVREIGAPPTRIVSFESIYVNQQKSTNIYAPTHC